LPFDFNKALDCVRIARDEGVLGRILPFIVYGQTYVDSGPESDKERFVVEAALDVFDGEPSVCREHMYRRGAHARVVTVEEFAKCCGDFGSTLLFDTAAIQAPVYIYARKDDEGVL